MSFGIGLGGMFCLSSIFSVINFVPFFLFFTIFPISSSRSESESVKTLKEFLVGVRVFFVFSLINLVKFELNFRGNVKGSSLFLAASASASCFCSLMCGSL